MCFKMQLINKFDYKKVQDLLIQENKFISNLFAISSIPDRTEDESEDEEQEDEGSNKKIELKGNKASRAKSLLELQRRLETITSKKHKLSYKEKLQKKGLKNRMKKKNKRDERSAQEKIKRAAEHELKDSKKAEVKEEKIKPAKPVFNSEDKIVYSKFDFSDIGKKNEKKVEKDPKKLLVKLQKEKEKINKLEESGNVQEAIEIKEKTAWKNALAKAQGEKVKDDPSLLKKSLKKKEQQVKSSKKKWEARIAGVNRAKEERQKKRTENIQKRKKDKKNKKLKKAVKKGKIIPGF